ncbi:MAG: SufS family cysteine desulfurase [Candidatus Abawacabacteria bacterium]|nr:SufS family cysteine desulfurase [Candidatus Abawacabacteria bacterium]
MPFSPQAFKKHFSIFKNQPNLVYLDNAATSQTPDSVLTAMNDYYQNYRANTHRGIYESSEKATSKYEDSREKVANYINAAPEEIIFTRGATHALNLVANGLTTSLQHGDEIVITEIEHHSNLVPWQVLAKRYQLVLQYIPINADGLLDLTDMGTIITKKTKVVACSHASNVLGTITPLEQIIQHAHNVGAVVVVDACQSIPHQRIDVRALNADFVVFSAHKMFGPTGIGILYGKKELLNQLPPFEYGGHMIHEVTYTDTTFAEAPERFEAGTANIAGVIGFGATIDFLQSLDWQGVQEHEQELVKYTLQKLRQLEAVIVHGPSGTVNRTGVISFNINTVHSHDAAHILAMNNIAVRAGHHCAQPLLHKLGIKNSIRASLYFYNTAEDIDALIMGLKKVITTMKA